ncbi:unnamed protein product [Effrenium voratum]|uniref:Uncharacterized protein n=1 Tax=Effrenium voratum TaxID=2562239 RepID=A0AA36MKT2_9DINO|nr:unnamed protein product [Effrenium voratum]
MIFLTLFITTGGILLGGLLHSYTIDTEMDYDRRYWIWRHYGTASREFDLLDVTEVDADASLMWRLANFRDEQAA